MFGIIDEKHGAAAQRSVTPSAFIADARMRTLDGRHDHVVDFYELEDRLNSLRVEGRTAGHRLERRRG